MEQFFVCSVHVHGEHMHVHEHTYIWQLFSFILYHS